jgi:transposase InsO family protein
MERRRFNAEFKREAVRLATQSGTSRAQVAQELGLYATILGCADVFDYLERFHNPRHRHSTFGQVSPDEFRESLERLGLVSGKTGEAQTTCAASEHPAGC